MQKDASAAGICLAPALKNTVASVEALCTHKPPHDPTMNTKHRSVLSISSWKKRLSAFLLRATSFYMIYPPRPVHVVQYRQY